jgi:hypothetical protein
MKKSRRRRLLIKPDGTNYLILNDGTKIQLGDWTEDCGELVNTENGKRVKVCP